MKDSHCCTCELDATFGSAGQRELKFPGTSCSTAKAMVMLGERLLVLAKVRLEQRPDVALAALHEDGTHDTGFGEQGFVMAPFGQGLRAAPADLIVTRAGKLLVLAEDQSQRDSQAMLARLNSDGSADHTFGNAGVARLELPTVPGAVRASDEPTAVIELQDGGLMVALTRFDQHGDSCGVLVRLQADGTLDEGFHSGGCFVFAPAHEPQVWFEGLLQQAGGRVVVWGSTATGSLLMPLDGPPRCAPGILLYDLTEDMAGRLLAAGATQLAPHRPALECLTDEGPDPRFNTGNTAVNSAAPEGACWLRCFTQRDGGIVTVGVSSRDNAALIGRYWGDGCSDQRFASGTGLVTGSRDHDLTITTCAMGWGGARVLFGGTGGSDARGHCRVLAYRTVTTP